MSSIPSVGELAGNAASLTAARDRFMPDAAYGDATMGIAGAVTDQCNEGELESAVVQSTDAGTVNGSRVAVLFVVEGGAIVNCGNEAGRIEHEGSEEGARCARDRRRRGAACARAESSGWLHAA